MIIIAVRGSAFGLSQVVSKKVEAVHDKSFEPRLL